MATLAHEVTWDIVHAWESYYPSAVCSGIVGDPAHQQSGGYHISIMDQSSNNYSVTRPDDKAPPGTWPKNLAAGIDMSMNPTDMKTCSDRLWWAWNDQTDPRRVYLNGFNGYFNEGGDAKRYDFVSQSSSTTTDDHKWHVHKEIRRKYVTDWKAAEAIKSILRGDTKQQYIEGEDMSWQELLTAGADAGGGTYPAKDWMIGANWRATDAWENTEIIKAEQIAQDAILNQILAAVTGGEGSDVADFLAAVEEKLAAQREFIKQTAEGQRKRIEDAVADLGEGGAAKVRSEIDTDH